MTHASCLLIASYLTVVFIWRRYNSRVVLAEFQKQNTTSIGLKSCDDSAFSL